LGILRPERTLADLIINKKSIANFAIASSALGFISICLNYAMWVFPIFEDPDFGNAAIGEYISSDFYKIESRAAGEQLELYNDGKTALKIADLKFFFPFRGVMVKHELTLIPTVELRPDGKYKYKFENSFKVSLNVIHLILFSLLLGLLLALGLYAFLNRPSKAQIQLEESILNDHFFIGEKATPVREMLAVDDRLGLIFNRFHSFVVDLNNRPRGAPPFKVKDEYDVQDLMLPLLRMEFGGVKREVTGPDIAGGATRADFHLPDEGVLIEIKKTRVTMSDRDLSDEMILDIARYSAYPNLKLIVFFIYDPDNRIRNPIVLIKEIEQQSNGVNVKVVVAPKWYQ
jgi:hypothetical protein